MNLGSCPYEGCTGVFLTELPDRPLPAFVRDVCEECHRVVWRKFSRVDPQAWTEEDFFAKFTIDEAAKLIVPKEVSA